MKIRKSAIGIFAVAAMIINMFAVLGAVVSAKVGDPVNVASSATVTAQGWYDDNSKPENINDGSTDTDWTRDGNDHSPSYWVNFAWDQGVTVAQMYVADRKHHENNTAGGMVTVTSEGKKYTFEFKDLPYNGEFLQINFDKAFTNVTNVRIYIKPENDGPIGLSEVVMLDAPGESPVKYSQVRYVDNLGCNLSVEDGSLIVTGSGKDKYITATGTRGGHMTWGGHMFLLAGSKYRFTMHAMIDSGANKDSLLCEIDDLGKFGAPSHQFFVKDFATPGQWEDVGFDVDVSGKPAGEQYHVEARNFYHEKDSAKLSIHYYTLEPTTVRSMTAAVKEVSTFTDKVFEPEDEKQLGSNTGKRDETGIVATPKDNGGHLTWGGNTKLPVGQYKMVVYAQIDNADLIGKDTPILFFDGTGKAELNRTLTGKHFTKVNKYEAVVFDLDVTEEVTTEIRWFYYPESGTSIKIDKIALLNADSQVPPPAGTFTDKVFEAEDEKQLGSNTGKRDETGIVATPKDNGGYITWGGNTKLPVGEYKMVVYAKIDNAALLGKDTQIMRFDGAGDKYVHTMTGKHFTKAGEYEAIVFNMNVTEEVTTEIRWFYFPESGTSIKIDKIALLNADSQVPPPAGAFSDRVFQAENKDDLGSNTGTRDNFGIYATPQDSGGYITWGGYTTLPVGQYNMVVYAKISSEDLVGKDTAIMFFDGTGKEEHNYRMTGKNFTKANQYEAIVVPLNIKAAQEVELRWFYYPESGTTVKIDKIALQKASSPIADPEQEYTFDRVVFEGENDQHLGSNTGKRDDFGIEATPKDNGGYITWGGNTKLPVGQYKMVVYANIGNPDVVGKDTQIMRFDGAGDKYVLSMTGKQFTKAEKYHAVAFDLNITEEVTTEIRWFYYPESGTSVKIDKIVLMDAKDVIDPPVQEPGRGDLDFEKKTYEAENLGNKVGYTDHTGRVGLAAVDGSDHIMWGGNTTLVPGKYKLVVYAKLLNDDAIGKNVRILNFDGAGPAYYYEIKGTHFAKKDFYYAISIPMDVRETLTFETRFWYFPESGADIKIDKLVLMAESDIPDEPVQEKEEKPVRPDGEKVYDNFVYDLSAANVPFRKDEIDGTTGRIENSSIVFDSSLYVAGGCDVINQRPYIANGKKVMRFYLRLMDVPTTTGELLKVYQMVHNNKLGLDLPGTVISVHTKDFKGVYNAPIVVDIPFEAEDCYAYSFKMDWNSTSTIAVDRVEITNPDAPVYSEEAVAVNAVEKNGVYTATIEKTADIANMSPFSSVAIKAGNVTYYVSYASISENVIQNGGKITVNIAKADAGQWKAINNAAKRSKVFKNGYDAYKVEAKVITADGTVRPMEPSKANRIDITASKDTMKKDISKMYGFTYDVKQNTLTPSSSKLGKDAHVNFAAPGSNIYLIGVASDEYIVSLRSQYDKDFPARPIDPEPGTDETDKPVKPTKPTDPYPDYPPDPDYGDDTQEETEPTEPQVTDSTDTEPTEPETEPTKPAENTDAEKAEKAFNAWWVILPILAVIAVVVVIVVILVKKNKDEEK